MLQKADGTIVFVLSRKEVLNLKYFHFSGFGNCTEIQLLIA